MISPGEFCKDGEFPIALFLTYSFDPLFFERIPWSDLRIGGARRIVVAADAGQVADAMRRCAGQIVHLGRNYALAETVLTNTFHPKLIARLSSKGGRVWVGSGNLTYTGWGGNSELATSWPIGPAEEDKGAWLDELFDVVANFVRSTTFADQIATVRREAMWLTSRSSSRARPPVLLGRQGAPLAPQVAARWRGRKFDEVKILTGSTDERGDFLRWAHRTLGVRKATLCLTPEHASFDANALAKLDIDVGIIRADPKKLMHAKLYWFSGPDGPACLVGSANCSAAAWLADGAGANVELMAVYDSPDEQDFKPVLSKFKAKALAPKDAFANAKAKPPKDEAPPASSYRLVGLRIRSHRIVEALIDPAPPALAKVTLRVLTDRHESQVPLVKQRQNYAGELPPDFSFGSITPFATAEIQLQTDCFITDARWIDSDALLARASTIRSLEKNLEDISGRVIFGADRQRIMEAIHAVSSYLLTPSQQVFANGSAGGSRPRHGAVRSNSHTDEDEKKTAPPVDPVAMVRSLHDLNCNNRSPLGASSQFSYGSLGGVMKLLFAQEEHLDEIDLSQEAKQDEDPPEKPDPPAKPAVPGQRAQHHADEHAFLVQFRAQLRDYLTHLGSKPFADTCLAEKLVQALVFPLAVCLRGHADGWLPANELSSVAPKVVSIMFEQEYTDGAPRGLVEFVRKRYAEVGRESEFLALIGGGLVWTVLLAALTSKTNGNGQAAVLMASALMTALESGDMLACATETDIRALINSIGIEEVKAT